MDLTWILVKDLNKSVKFYTEKVGLKLNSLDEAFGWAELQGHDGGSMLGIAQMHPSGNEWITPGQNAVVTLSVENLDKAIAELKEKGAKFIGETQEVPDHVKMQMVQDLDGNHFQLVESL